MHTAHTVSQLHVSAAGFGHLLKAHVKIMLRCGLTLPLEQAPWGGLLHLPQSLHGQDLNNINDHTRNLKRNTSKL